MQGRDGAQMPTRVRIVVTTMLLAGAYGLWWSARSLSHDWLHFAVYLTAVLLSSGLKVAMPRGDGTMSVNFPFILLGVLELSPLQAVALAGLSVFAQCRFKVLKAFTLVQIAFNISNAVAATACASFLFAYLTRRHIELAPSLAAAAVAYFFANTIPVALVIGWSKGEGPFTLWRRQFPWYLPFYLVGAVLAVVAHLISVRYGWLTSSLLIPMVYTIYQVYKIQLNLIREKQKHLEETEALHLRTIEGLAMAIEAKDQNTHDHLLRVHVYASEIGKSLGLDEQQMKALLTASYLHDIGKLAVPEHIINKPGKLTREEFEKMKTHTVVGAEILERVRFPYPVVPIVRSHHEAWDGSGYPDGLKGEEIPIGARILTVVDCFDALASDRPYRRAMPLAEAMTFVREKAGTQFDPRVVAVLEERCEELEEMARKASEKLTPLNTEVSVERGEAPGAGLQQDGVSEQQTASVSGDAASGSVLAHRTSFEALSMIAAASQEAQAVFEMSQSLGNSLSPNETISVMSARLRRSIPFDTVAVYLRKGDELTTQYMEGIGAEQFSARSIPMGEGLSGWVAESGRPILNGNPQVEVHYRADAVGSHPLCSALSLPLFDLRKEVFGALTLYSRKPDGFTHDHLRILLAMESKFSMSLQNALEFCSPERNASADYVTQLPNMRHFFVKLQAELNRAQRLNEGLAVVVCDLNSFKQVNDQFGHLAGNALLRSVAEQFRSCCRPTDVVARIGGDEFVFLFPHITCGDVSGCLDRIHCAVDQASIAADLPFGVSTSVGAALYPQDGATVEELLGVADRRMYLHKRTFADEHDLRSGPGAEFMRSYAGAL